jgi:hypothetical protein
MVNSSHLGLHLESLEMVGGADNSLQMKLAAMRDENREFIGRRRTLLSALRRP